MGAVGVERYSVQFTRPVQGPPLFFKMFSLRQSLCLAVQGEGQLPNRLVAEKVILKAWFNFRVNFLEYRSDFDLPASQPRLPAANSASGRRRPFHELLRRHWLSGTDSGEAKQPSRAQPHPVPASALRRVPESEFRRSGKGSRSKRLQTLARVGVGSKAPLSPKGPRVGVETLPGPDSLSSPERQVCFQALPPV